MSEGDTKDQRTILFQGAEREVNADFMFGDLMLTEDATFEDVTDGAINVPSGSIILLSKEGYEPGPIQLSVTEPFRPGMKASEYAGRKYTKAVTKESLKGKKLKGITMF